jgi:hypothetical protein
MFKSRISRPNRIRFSKIRPLEPYGFGFCKKSKKKNHACVPLKQNPMYSVPRPALNPSPSIPVSSGFQFAKVISCPHSYLSTPRSSIDPVNPLLSSAGGAGLSVVTLCVQKLGGLPGGGGMGGGGVLIVSGLLRLRETCVWRSDTTHKFTQRKELQYDEDVFHFITKEPYNIEGRSCTDFLPKVHSEQWKGRRAGKVGQC